MTVANDLMAQLAKKGSGRKKGKKGRKIGRYNKHPSSLRYRAERRWEKNQAKRIACHVKKYPDDEQARSAYHRITGRRLLCAHGALHDPASGSICLRCPAAA